LLSKEPVKVFRKVRKVKTFDDYDEAAAHTFGQSRWIGSVKQQG
jgi:hypothetical protein